MLKAEFQECQYVVRPVTKSECHTDGIIQNVLQSLMIVDEFEI